MIHDVFSLRGLDKGTIIERYGFVSKYSQLWHTHMKKPLHKSLKSHTFL